MNLLDAIANAVCSAGYESTQAPPELSKSARQGIPTSSKPVFQFNSFPMTLDANNYEKSRSGSNPNGDLKSLFAFRQLVDPMPGFSQFYSPRGNSTEKIYEHIVEGASASDDSPFTVGVIADARRQFSKNSFSGMDGTPTPWRPVYAVPEDWYDTSQNGRFQDLDIDLNDLEGRDGRFTTLGDMSALQLSVGGERGSSMLVDTLTKIRSIKMKYLLVQFRRPWLNFLLFETGGWYLSSQPQGFCSSGNTDENSGVFPLLPTGMLLAKDITVDAEWSARDQALLDAAKLSNKPVFLGPLAVHPQVADSSLHVIGWISSLVPYSPKASDLRPGSVLVRNNGAFVLRFTVAWQQNGQVTKNESGNLPVLAAQSISIPPEANNVSIKIEIMTFPAPIETWKTIATYDFDTPVKKCYEVSGATWSPTLEEILCAA